MPSAAEQTGTPPPGVLRRATDWLVSPSPRTMRRLALAGVVTAALIFPSGAAVRLSDSGLGCTTWPNCTNGQLTAGGAHGGTLVHQWIEFGNRLVTIAIFISAMLVLVAAWRFRDGDRGRRKDLVALATVVAAGIPIQAVIGGILVLTGLDPVWLSIHFLASIPVLAAAVAVHVRSAEPAGPVRPLVRPQARLAAAALLALVTVMMAAGTVVTGTGPLAGANDVPRYPFPLREVTQLHADIGWLLGGLAIAVVLILPVSDAPRRAIRLSWLTLGLIGVQGVIGYVQYATHLPAGLVWVHVTMAMLILLAALRLNFALRERLPAELPAHAGSGTVPGPRSQALPSDAAVR